ncbi:hypothetical protein DFH09DRAFT_1109904 [Mycena vulgaris]|nr:hypothetical protein DFH09DRAFT_1109904 [Mycena vulgaris]
MTEGQRAFCQRWHSGIRTSWSASARAEFNREFDEMDVDLTANPPQNEYYTEIFPEEESCCSRARMYRIWQGGTLEEEAHSPSKAAHSDQCASFELEAALAVFENPHRHRHGLAWWRPGHMSERDHGFPRQSKREKPRRLGRHALRLLSPIDGRKPDEVAITYEGRLHVVRLQSSAAITVRARGFPLRAARQQRLQLGLYDGRASAPAARLTPATTIRPPLPARAPTATPISYNAAASAPAGGLLSSAEAPHFVGAYTAAVLHLPLRAGGVGGFEEELPRTIFAIQDAPPTWTGADDEDDDMGSRASLTRRWRRIQASTTATYQARPLPYPIRRTTSPTTPPPAARSEVDSEDDSRNTADISLLPFVPTPNTKSVRFTESGSLRNPSPPDLKPWNSKAARISCISLPHGSPGIRYGDFGALRSSRSSTPFKMCWFVISLGAILPSSELEKCSRFAASITIVTGLRSLSEHVSDKNIRGTMESLDNTSYAPSHWNPIKEDWSVTPSSIDVARDCKEVPGGNELGWRDSGRRKPGCGNGVIECTGDDSPIKMAGEAWAGGGEGADAQDSAVKRASLEYGYNMGASECNCCGRDDGAAWLMRHNELHSALADTIPWWQSEAECQVGKLTGTYGTFLDTVDMNMRKGGSREIETRQEQSKWKKRRAAKRKGGKAEMKTLARAAGCNEMHTNVADEGKTRPRAKEKEWTTRDVSYVKGKAEIVSRIAGMGIVASSWGYRALYVWVVFEKKSSSGNNEGGEHTISSLNREIWNRNVGYRSRIRRGRRITHEI